MLTLAAGCCSHYFATETDGETCVLDEPLVVIAAGTVSRMQGLLPVAEAAARATRPLLVIADDVVDEALSVLVTNKESGRLACCAVGIGSSAKSARVRRDISRFAGGRVFGDEAGLVLEWAGIDNVGSVRRAILSEAETRLLAPTAGASE